MSPPSLEGKYGGKKRATIVEIRQFSNYEITYAVNMWVTERWKYTRTYMGKKGEESSDAAKQEVRDISAF
jgi:hypothetical protein